MYTILDLRILMPVRLKSFVVCLLLMEIAAISAQAQARWLEIETNHGEANVYADSTWLGPARRGFFELPIATRTITLVSSVADSWSISPISRELSGVSSDTARIEILFPYYYRLETVPSGAVVYLEKNSERHLLGVTPLIRVSDVPLANELVFVKDGFLTRRVHPGSDLWNRHLVLLEAVSNLDLSTLEISVKTRSNTRWIDYAAIGTAIAGGILAVHYKTKADNRFDDYNETRNPALKSDVKQLDLYSGVALGAMQVGLGVFAFRLIF